MKENLKQILIRASNDLNSNQLIYFVHFNYGWASHSLKINNVELFQKYQIPSGWDGIGEKELIQLEKEGFLKKVSETIDECCPTRTRTQTLHKPFYYILNL
ncbi:MAG: hypothetical protein COA33_010455 [Fluviicola sp.]|nr:hypothetical protein [Fluviicola sp.]